MKATGFVRRIDALGRIVIPIEIRRVLRVKETDPMEIFIVEDGIVLRPHRAGCACCGSERALVHVAGIALCPACIHRFRREADQRFEPKAAQADE